VLGGCVITVCDLNWKCVDCGLQIYKNKKYKCIKCEKVYYSIITPLGSYTICPDCEKLINA
jgi:DNA-directed RNA polymerase subunit RPC12/RpoP